MQYYTLPQAQVNSRFNEVLEQVCQDHMPIIVTRGHRQNVILISEEDYLSLDETAYLLNSTKNKKRLQEAIKTPARQRIKFNSLKELSDEIGISS